MAEDSHLAVLRQGVSTWNAWRRDNPSIQPDLDAANLANGQFASIDLSGAKLLWTNLSNANLSYANLRGAHISSANLSCADLRGADLSTSRIHKGNLSGAILLWTDLRCTYLVRSDMSRAVLWETIFSDTDLTEVIGLDSCIHNGRSTIDHRTITKSTDLPKKFLLACGIPDHMAECLLFQRTKTPSFFTGFISYSSADSEFVNKLYQDLLESGVNSWLDSEQLKPADPLWDSFSKAIEDHDKLILVCSSNSITNKWVKDEVIKAFSEERTRRSDVVIPIRIDDTIMSSNEPWAQKLIDSRYIGDFSEWQNSVNYENSFESLLRALRRI